MLVLSQTPVLLREDEKHPTEFTRYLPLGSTASLRREKGTTGLVILPDPCGSCTC